MGERAAVAGPFRDSLVAVDDLRRVAAGLAVTGIGWIAQRFAGAVVQHQELGLYWRRWTDSGVVELLYRSQSTSSQP